MSSVAVRPLRFQPARISEAELRRLYLEERLPIAQIAAIFGISVSTVGNTWRGFNVPIRPHRVGADRGGDGMVDGAA